MVLGQDLVEAFRPFLGLRIVFYGQTGSPWRVFGRSGLWCRISQVKAISMIVRGSHTQDRIFPSYISTPETGQTPLHQSGSHRLSET